MDLGLKGKRALVTGSTAGIGLATARSLADEGASVTVNGRTAERVAQAVEGLEREVPGASVNGIAADLGTWSTTSASSSPSRSRRSPMPTGSASSRPTY